MESMKRVLALDGGGIRGLVPAVFLRELEQATGKPASTLFDLVAGTSTGGIIALGIGLGFDGEDLVRLYRNRGETIFSRRTLGLIFGVIDQLRGPKYLADGLEQVLQETFGNALLGQSALPTLVTSYSVQEHTLRLFRSWDQDGKTFPMRAVARATSAAPTYFPPAVIGAKTYLDGGMEANNPASVAYDEARVLWPDERDFLVVSLGTGSLTRKYDTSAMAGWGVLGWAGPALHMLFDAGADAVEKHMTRTLGNRHVRFQPELLTASDDMDNVEPINLDQLEQDTMDEIARTDLVEQLAARLE